MSAGTLTLTNNSAAVTGSGTAFITELAVGDFIVVTVGGIPYTLAIKTVNSNTSLTLVSNYTGPTQGGAAWYAVPRVAMNLVTAALAAQSAEALRGLNYDKQNWQRLFSASGNITVTLPDGSSFTGPSWQYMVNTVATKTNGAVPVNQGGTGATTAEGSRTNLGLGTSATRDAYSTSGKILSENDFGVGAISTAEDARHDSFGYTAFVRIASGSNNGFVTQNGALGYRISRGADNKVVNAWDASTNEVYFRKMMNATYGNWYKYYTSANTTTTSDGTLKAASPVARIVKGQAECQRTDIDESGFIWCGCGTANAEAEGIKISRLDAGVYVIIGSAGLASDGWQLLPPMDPSGMGEMGVVEAEQTESGALTIRLYKRKYMLSVEGEIIKTKGDPIDVPENSWIDVRLDMPEKQRLE